MNQQTLGSGHRATRWAIGALFLGCLTVVVDGSAVVVALPRIKVDLGFSDASLVWIVNAYTAAYGGLLILCGGLGDLFGHRRVFLLGTAIFTFASIGCGFSNSQESFISWRIVQGLGGSAIATMTFALIVNTFQDGAARTKAMGIYAFTGSSGGIAGLLLGGLLTDALDWHWIFLLNIPIGLAVFVICAIFLPDRSIRQPNETVDLLGSITVTLALVTTLFAIQQIRIDGWSSSRTASHFAIAIALLGLFIYVESRARKPQIPRDMFRLRNLMLCCAANALSSLLGSAAIFVSLYMQFVLERSPMEVGLTFMLPNVVFAAFSQK